MNESRIHLKSRTRSQTNMVVHIVRKLIPWMYEITHVIYMYRDLDNLVTEDERTAATEMDRPQLIMECTN